MKTWKVTFKRKGMEYSSAISVAANNRQEAINRIRFSGKTEGKITARRCEKPEGYKFAFIL